MARQPLHETETQPGSESDALVAGPFQIAPLRLIARPFRKPVTSTQLGTEFSVTPGQANHSIYKDPSSACRNSIRPREILDFTVPILI